jgi:thiosulfate/3-mercaptopyruvate sulfurtransferase
MKSFKAMTVALLLGMALSLPAAAGENMFEQEVTTEKVAVKLVRDVAQGDYGLVTTDELKALMNAKKDMVIVDTMPYEASYKKNHIPGAVQFLFPIPDMVTWDAKECDGKTQADFEKLLGPDKNKLIVVYCGFVKCTRSHNGAAWARKLGYTNVKRYSGGIYAWKGAGFPIEDIQ